MTKLYVVKFIKDEYDINHYENYCIVETEKRAKEIVSQKDKEYEELVNRHKEKEKKLEEAFKKLDGSLEAREYRKKRFQVEQDILKGLGLERDYCRIDWYYDIVDFIKE